MAAVIAVVPMLLGYFNNWLWGIIIVLIIGNPVWDGFWKHMWDEKVDEFPPVKDKLRDGWSFVSGG